MLYFVNARTRGAEPIWSMLLVELSAPLELIVNWVMEADPKLPTYTNLPSGSKVMNPAFVPAAGAVPVMAVKSPTESIVYCEIVVVPEFTT